MSTHPYRFVPAPRSERLSAPSVESAPTSFAPPSADLRLDFARTRQRDGAALLALAANVLPITERLAVFAPRLAGPFPANDVTAGAAVPCATSRSLVVARVSDIVSTPPPSERPGRTCA